MFSACMFSLSVGTLVTIYSVFQARKKKKEKKRACRFLFHLDLLKWFCVASKLRSVQCRYCISARVGNHRRARSDSKHIVCSGVAV